jgi:ribosomal protein S16
MNTPTNPTTAIAVTNLLARPVVNADGEPVGKLQDLLVEGSALHTAVIALGGVLGVGARTAAIPFADCQIEFTQDGPLLRLPALRSGEVLVAGEYQPVGGTQFDRMKEQAANLTQAAVAKAAELGQKVSDSAADLAKQATEKSSDIADRIAGGAAGPTRDQRES